MAMTAKADEQTAAQAEAPEKDSPLLDLSDAAVKKFIKTAKARGFVTLDELNDVLPSEEFSPDQIEDIMSSCPTWASPWSRARTRRRPPKRRRPRTRSPPPAAPWRRRRASRPSRNPRRARRAHRRSGAHVPARNGLGRAALARGRDRHRQAHRGRPRRHDPRPVRKPAHLRGHHDLARRAAGREDPPARHHRSRSHLRGPRGQGRAGARGGRRRPPVEVAAPRPPPRAATSAADGEPRPEGELEDDEDFENALSLSAMEAELKPKVIETLDNIADTYEKLRKLQDKKVEMQVASEQFPRQQQRGYDKRAKRSSTTSRSSSSTTPASRAWSSSSTPSTSSCRSKAS